MAAPVYKRLPAQLIARPLEGLGQGASAANALLGLGNRGIESLTGYKDVLPSRLSVNMIPGLGNLPNIPLPTTEDIQKYVTQPAFGKENLQSETFPERAYERFGRALPATALAAATGGISLLSSAAGSVAGQAAQDIGAPWPIQVVADIFGSKGYDKLLQKLGSSKIPINTLAILAEEAKGKFYATERELGSKITLNAEPIEEGLIKTLNKVKKDTTLSELERNKLIRDIDEYGSDIINGNTTASQLFERRKELNNIIPRESGTTKNYYEAIRKPISAVMESQKTTNPEWYKAYKSGDNIHQAMNFSNNFIEGLKDYPKIAKTLKNPLAYGVASLGPAAYFTKDPLTLLATSGAVTGGASAIKKGSEIFGFLSHGSEPRKLLMQASEEMLKRNYPAAARTYAALNGQAEKYEAMQKKIKANKESKLKKATAHLSPY